MDDKEIEKIAQAIAAKIAEPGGNQLLGCGSASSTSDYRACYSGSNFTCSSYECGGAGNFRCGSATGYPQFGCTINFDCYTNFTCDGFSCASGAYNI